MLWTYADRKIISPAGVALGSLARVEIPERDHPDGAVGAFTMQPAAFDDFGREIVAALNDRPAPTDDRAAILAELTSELRAAYPDLIDGDPEESAPACILALARQLASAGPRVEKAPPLRRLLVTLNGGMIETVAAEGCEGLGIELVTIDFDVEGENNTIEVDGERCYVTVDALPVSTPDDTALARMARDTWALK